MEKNITIRPERVSDYQQVEDIIRQAFYNLYTPGCTEHYLAHAIRPHPDFLPELDLVLELDGRVVGNIMYTKSTLVDEAGKEKGILTFGPVCIRPGLQRRGYGRLLMEESFRRASAMGYEAIVIFGDPNNYVGRGFQSCKKHRVHLEDGTYPAAMLVKELEPGTLAGKSWIYRQSPAFVFAGLTTACRPWRKSACPVRRPLRFSAAPSFCDRSAHFFHWKYPVCLTE